METKTASPVRPTFLNCPDALREFAIITAKHLVQEYDDEYHLEQIGKCLRGYWNSDAYELAKELEEEGFEINSSIVSELEIVAYDGKEIIKKYTQKWVEENNINALLNIGDSIVLGTHIYNGAEYGLITDIMPLEAKYKVKPDNSFKNDTRRYLIKYENAVKKQ